MKKTIDIWSSLFESNDKRSFVVCRIQPIDSSKFKSKPNLKNTGTYLNPVTKKSNRLQLENILKKTNRPFENRTRPNSTSPHIRSPDCLTGHRITRYGFQNCRVSHKHNIKSFIMPQPVS